MKTPFYIKRYLKEDLIILTIISAILIIPAKADAQHEEKDLRPKHERIINHFDKDGDGVLNDREAYHARHFYNRWKQGQGASDRPRELRRRFDRNSDGRLGPRERSNARRIQARRNR